MRAVLASAQIALAIVLLSMAAVVAAPRIADAASYFSGTKTVSGGGHYGWDRATCPAGYRVTGGGYLAQPDTAIVHESRPDGTSGWIVRGLAGGGSGAPYLTAYAVCVR